LIDGDTALAGLWPPPEDDGSIRHPTLDLPLNELKPRVAAALAERYLIERELGRGGTATVYLAQDLRHGRRVAVKVLYPELAASLGPERFLREIEIAAGLAHPHILPLHDSGEAEGFLYYVMPYVEGETLRHRLRREIQMPVEEALRIAREVAEALNYAHQRGIVHRDIKPENILLEGDHAFVADFGVARAIETAASERLTETGLAVGTAVYMSPEQAGGTSHVDGRSDIYSLGCVLFEMLAGEPPFGGSTPQAVISKHMQAPVPDLRVVRSTVSSDLQRIVETALAKVPADRFATAERFAEALRTTSPESASPRRWRAAGAGVAALLAAATVATLVLSNTRSDGGRATAEARSPAGPPRIAVLYFDDLSADSGLRHIADGITEELIYELSGVSAFRVISRNGVQPYRGRRVPLDSMIAALRVSTVIDGSVQRQGDRIRVRVQLIDAGSDTYVDSLSVEQRLDDPVTFERNVAQELAAGLRRQMGRETRLRTAPLGTDLRSASELARRAQAAREDAREIAESPHPEDMGTALDALRRADSLLALAQAADPGWSRLWTERGWVAADQARLLADAARVAALRQALRLAEDAVSRAPDSPAALELRGIVRLRLVVELQAAPDEPDRLQKAEADLRAALDRDSTLASAWANLGELLWTKGSTAEAALAARRALREDTYLAEAPDVYRNLFFNDLMLGDFGDASEWCRRGRLTFPDRWQFVECELTLMRHDASRKPDPDSAWKLVKVLGRLDPPARAKSEGRAYHTIYRRIVAATISARAGHRDVARAEIARARRATLGDTTLDMDLNYDEGYLRLVLGERQRAVELLRAYVKARPLSRDYLARDPLLQRLQLGN
jgi:TolB-like protein/tRNA A-37 threonylcarbamoyl transferase component Bud32/tetratricopeptide (TPR) repeat protein